MLIDWFTVIAQTINFLILVWLLKRFLYGPILNAIDARETRIATELADADAKRNEAEALDAAFRRNRDDFDRQRAALLTKAMSEADTERQRLLDEARAEAESLRARQQDQIKDEYQVLGEEIIRRTQAEVFALARKMLLDMADTTLEARMAGVFIARLHDLNTEEKQRLMPLFSSAVMVRSAFDLTPAQHTTIEGAIRECFGLESSVGFETVPELISGIELMLQGQKIAWSINEHVDTLGRGVNELLKARYQSDTDSRSE